MNASCFITDWDPQPGFPDIYIKECVLQCSICATALLVIESFASNLQVPKVVWYSSRLTVYDVQHSLPFTTNWFLYVVSKLFSSQRRFFGAVWSEIPLTLQRFLLIQCTFVSVTCAFADIWWHDFALVGH
jgi:hypothetical protein